MKKRFGLRTKIEAGIIIFVLFTVGISSVLSVTRTITDSSDTLDTYIRNSKGNYWSATAANIQLAIDDLNSTDGGKVWIPSGVFTLTGESIRIWDSSVQLMGAGVGSYPAQSHECTEIKGEFGGSGYYAIHVGESSNSNMFSSVSNMIIQGRGADSDLDGGIWLENTQHCSIDNVYINDFYMESPYPAVGINLSGSGTGTYYNTINNVRIRRCTVGVCFGYNANGNAFETGVISNSRALTEPYPVGIWMRGSDTNWVGTVDIEDHSDAGATAVYMSSDATVSDRVCGVHKFMGTRFEDNDRMVYIDTSAGSGFNNFIGCSFAGVGGEQDDWFTDGESASFPSMYTNCLVGTADGMGTITSNIDTMIRNSNGKYWAATGANIQAAIWDLNDTGGTVWLPNGNFTISPDLDIDDNVLVVGIPPASNQHNYDEGTLLYLTGDTKINITYGRLWNVQVNTNSGWNGDYAVKIHGKNAGNEFKTSLMDKILDNVNIHQIGTSNVGTGLGIIAIGGGWTSCISSCYFGSFSINGFNLGVQIHAEDGDQNGYVNANNFASIAVYDCTYGMNITESNNGECNYNTIYSYMQQPSTGTIQGIHIVSDGNNFQNCMFWDWSGYGCDESLNISGNYNSFTGYFAIDSGGFNDTGFDNRFIMQGTESRVFTIYPTGTNDGTHIDNLISAISLNNENITVIFMPGVYDIDTVISDANCRKHYIFREGAYFDVNANIPAWSVVMTLINNDSISGSGVLDGNDVANVYGIYCNDYNSINGLEIKNFARTGINVLSGQKGCIISNNILSNNLLGISVLGDNNSVTNNIFNDCTTDLTDTGSNNIIKDNIGYDNSTYEYIPCSGSVPYSSPSDGASYFCSTNQTLAVYWNSAWHHFVSE